MNLKRHWEEVLRTKKDPHNVALGFAVGVFISVLPTPGFNVLLGLLIVLIYEKVNKYSLFAAIAVFNPFVLGPVMTLSYVLGDLILGPVPVQEFSLTFMDHLVIFTRRLLLGSVILASLFSVVSYYLVKYVYSKKVSLR